MDSTLINVLVGSGGAAAALGAVVVLFVLGLIYPKPVVTDLKTENAELKEALKDARAQAAAAITAASATKDILAAIQLGRDIGHERAGP